jgi:trk system potassium uptake protein TrkH
VVNWKIISKILGSLLFIEGSFMGWCLIMAIGYGESDILPFIISMIIIFGGAFGFRRLGHSDDNMLSRRDAYVVVTITWIVFSLFGMLPFLLSGALPSITDAFFETMSGFTTTGVTVIKDVESLPHALLFWRSLMQWIGGLGIVFFTIAILPSLVGGSVKVFAAEATGPMRSKMHPKLSTSAKWIWSIYVLLTVVCALSFWLAGMGWFDAINYSMSTTATGGFSTHNGSIFLASPLIEYLAILFQFLAGINFTLLYMTFVKFQFRRFLNNSEFKFYVIAIIVSTVWIMILLITRMGYDIEGAFRSALFQVVSFITTTGLSNTDAGFWPQITWVILGVLMFIGACAGSTTGGFKSIRVMMLINVLRNEFRRILHPNAVLPVKVNGQNIPQEKLTTLLSFFTIYIIMMLFICIVMVLSGIDFANAATISLSLMSNVGAGLDTNIGPVMSWADLSIGIKWFCSALMLVGRLEVIAVLVLFTRSFWKEN